MTTLQKLKEMAEVRVYQTHFALDAKRKVLVNVKLASWADYERCCNEMTREPAAFLSSQFLDPNTGERLFSEEDVKHLTKQMVMKLAKLWIDVQLDRVTDAVNDER